MKAKILIVEDDARLRNLLLESVSLEGHQVETAGSAELAIKVSKKKNSILF